MVRMNETYDGEKGTTRKQDADTAVSARTLSAVCSAVTSGTEHGIRYVRKKTKNRQRTTNDKDLIKDPKGEEDKR